MGRVSAEGLVAVAAFAALREARHEDETVERQQGSEEHGRAEVHGERHGSGGVASGIM